jgi:hypothetical protein
LRLRYRFFVAVAAALLSAGWSFGSTAHASTMGTSHVSSTSSVHSDACRNCGGHSEGRHSDFRGHDRDHFRDHCCDHDRFHDRDHCCDHFHDHCCDNGDEGNFESDCDWLRDHDHDRWWRDCQH